nr:hypothetical protein B11C_110412 [Bartonella sp. 1-1C]
MIKTFTVSRKTLYIYKSSKLLDKNYNQNSNNRISINSC